jgi:hypothetical protein
LCLPLISSFQDFKLLSLQESGTGQGFQGYFPTSPVPQALRKFRTVPLEQMAEVEDRGMALPGIPLWREPPAPTSAGMVQAGLEQAQARRRD